MAAEIEKTLVCSTGNLQQATCDQIGKEYIGAEWEYGGWVHVETTNAPPELKAILHHARGMGCTWVRFDCDAELLPETFPRWEW